VNQRLTRTCLALLLAAPLLIFATPAIAADKVRDLQWHLDYLHIAQAQKVSQGQGVIVAVIDTGVDATHPDLTGNVLPGTVTAKGRSGDGRTDTDGHGTAMAGFIAAHGHGPGNGSGALGIAPKAKVLPVTVTVGLFTDQDKTETSRAINFAVDHNAKVINISLGGVAGADDRAAVQRALAADVVVVAAVGNLPGALTVDFPASFPGVVAVGAVDRNGNHAAVSVNGPQVLISAPGQDTWSTDAGGGYSGGVGTSDATAIVSGAAALIRSRYPKMSAAEVVHRLTATATDKGPPGRDDQYGYGVLNLVAALTADVPPLQASATATGATAPTTTQAGPPARTAGALLVLIAALAAVIVLVVAGLAWAAARRRRTLK
jgi:type VII secretion-associated serine protease mycosin